MVNSRLLKRLLSLVAIVMFALVVVWVTYLSADDNEPEGTHPKPVSALPRQVTAGDGTVSLFADYAHAKDDQITLYLVNKTKSAMSFPAQDGDLYIKLERQLPDRDWERAQTHAYSWCGNSYHSVDLKPNEFIALKGIYKKTGKAGVVRYRSFENLSLISNSGQGFVDEAQVLAARVDDMSKRHVP
ncbi:MAG TPA: hypothetical protein VEK08_25825 [Planctomycetota bacterium]|nr:hypothetical protein [Planctomycetota bacterium]